MKFLLWYWFEGRKSTVQQLMETLHRRNEGKKQRQKTLRELAKLGPPPKYETNNSVGIIGK